MNCFFENYDSVFKFCQPFYDWKVFERALFHQHTVLFEASYAVRQKSSC